MADVHMIKIHDIEILRELIKDERKFRKSEYYNMLRFAVSTRI